MVQKTLKRNAKVHGLRKFALLVCISQFRCNFYAYFFVVAGSHYSDWFFVFLCQQRVMKYSGIRFSGSPCQILGHKNTILQHTLRLVFSDMSNHMVSDVFCTAMGAVVLMPWRRVRLVAILRQLHRICNVTLRIWLGWRCKRCRKSVACTVDGPGLGKFVVVYL